MFDGALSVLRLTGDSAGANGAAGCQVSHYTGTIKLREVRLRSGDIRNRVRAQDLTRFLLHHADEYE